MRPLLDMENQEAEEAEGGGDAMRTQNGLPVQEVEAGQIWHRERAGILN